jgi:hypothetical protein
MNGPRPVSRRVVLAALAAAGVAGIAAAKPRVSFDEDEDNDDPAPRKKGPGTIDWGDDDETPTEAPPDEDDSDCESDDEDDVDTAGRTIVVDPGAGDDDAAGTSTEPLATLAAALDAAQRGDTILLWAGTERVRDPTTIRTDDLTVTVAPGATFTLDASRYDPGREPYGSGGALTLSDTTGVTIDGTPGRIEIRDSGWLGLLVRRSRAFTVRGVTVANCSQSGFRVGAGCADGLFEWCASIGNFGPRRGQAWGGTTGGAADGFSVAAGSDNPRSEWPRRITFRHCLAHHNSDDGWDLIRAEDCLIERCVSYWNGYSLTGRLVSNAPGAGFKLGYGRSYYRREGNDPPERMQLRESVTYGNGAWGVTYGGGEGHAVDRVTAFDCNRKRGRTPIGFWSPEGGTVTRCLATGIERRSAVDARDNVVRDDDEWGVDLRTDPRGHARTRATFGRPTTDSPFDAAEVGAVRADDTWLADVLAMRERPVTVVF